MKEESRWVTAAFTTDAFVAHLLLHLKQSSSETTILNTTSFHRPATWGDRKSRSKQRSPGTPFSWSGGSGGGGGSDGDGDGESCRILAGDRSVKVGGSTTFIDTRKRKLDLHQNPLTENNLFVQTSREEESEIVTKKRRVVLPDLNETSNYEEVVAL